MLDGAQKENITYRFVSQPECVAASWQKQEPVYGDACRPIFDGLEYDPCAMCVFV